MTANKLDLKCTGEQGKWREDTTGVKVLKAEKQRKIQKRWKCEPKRREKERTKMISAEPGYISFVSTEKTIAHRAQFSLFLCLFHQRPHRES